MTAGVTLLAVMVLLVGPARAQAPGASTPGPAIEEGSEVSLEYTLSDAKGKILDTNRGRLPLTLTQGEHQVVRGLEQALTGMRAGDEKKIVVEPRDGYGDVDPEAVAEVPKERLPPNALREGVHLVARSPDGATRLVRVKEVKETTVVIDLNHPFAGLVLHFEIRILQVEPPPRK
jgi:FKBP-type peptidyl-prolyl cis-trans isomerase SlyD